MRKKLKNISAGFWFFVFLYFSIQNVSAQHYGPEQKISVEQKFPEAVRPGSDFIIEIKIKKGNITGLAKFQQYIAPGMTASAVDNGGADFSIDAQNVKFVWTSIPQSEDITIRYKISVSQKLLGKKFLSGTFSYVENDRTKKTSLVPKEIDINPSAPASEAVATTESKPAPEEVKTEKTAPSAEPEEPEESEPEEKAEPVTGHDYPVPAASEKTEPEKKTKEPAPAENTAPTAEAPATPATSTPASKAKTAESPVGETAPANTGITFKVQIAAMNEKHFRRKNYFQEKFGLQMEVAAEEHEGLKKYTVGNFSSYAEARKLRDDILPKADGSFVVAYKDGARIPVAEAMEMLRKK